MSVAQVLATALCLTIFSFSAAFAESSRLTLEEAIDAAGVSFVEKKPVTHIETDGSEGKGLTITYSPPDDYVYDDKRLPESMRTVASLACQKYRRELGADAFETKLIVEFKRVISDERTSSILLSPVFTVRRREAIQSNEEFPPYRHCIGFEAKIQEPLSSWVSIAARHFAIRLRSHHLSLTSVQFRDMAKALQWDGLDPGKVWFAQFKFSEEAGVDELSSGDLDEALELACQYIRERYTPHVDPNDQTTNPKANMITFSDSSRSIRRYYYFAEDASCAVDYNKWPMFKQSNKRHDPNDWEQ